MWISKFTKKRRVLRRLILHTYIIYDTYLLILVTEQSCVVKDIRDRQEMRGQEDPAAPETDMLYKGEPPDLCWATDRTWSRSSTRASSSCRTRGGTRTDLLSCTSLGASAYKPPFSPRWCDERGTSHLRTGHTRISGLDRGTARERGSSRLRTEVYQRRGSFVLWLLLKVYL